MSSEDLNAMSEEMLKKGIDKNRNEVINYQFNSNKLHTLNLLLIPQPPKPVMKLVT